jgi:hypothetical protein
VTIFVAVVCSQYQNLKSKKKENPSKISLFLFRSLSLFILHSTMKLSTAAAVLLSTAYGTTAFVPRAPFVPSRMVVKQPLFMSEAPPTVPAAETYE